MLRHFSIIAGLVLAAAVAEPMPAYASEANQFWGTVTGATIGGIVGNQVGRGEGRVAATAVGVVAGGWIGNNVGSSIDNNNIHTTSSSSSLPPVMTQAGAFTATKSYKPNYVGPDDSAPTESVYDNDHGSYCRTYSEQVRVGDHFEENYGTACLQPDGTWRAVDQ